MQYCGTDDPRTSVGQAVDTSGPGPPHAAHTSTKGIHVKRPLLTGIATALSAVAIVAPAQAAPSLTTRTLTPKVQRTVGFNGYATYVFHAPKGRRILSASARISGKSRAALVRHASISHNHARFTVQLVFRGEQGTPGKLVVRLRFS